MSRTTVPAVSVLMTVFNGSPYIREAIDSILGQSFKDFEFIIVDDGSTDETPRILSEYSDPRIKLIASEHVGLTSALNLGFRECQADLVARMDADDIALAERLEVQVEYLRGHPDVEIVCGDIVTIDQQGRVTGQVTMKDVNNCVLREGLLYRRHIKPIVHPTVLMKRKVWERLKGYREYSSAEDHDFWLRALDVCEMRRINMFLLRYREHRGGVSQLKAARQAASGCMSAVNYLVHATTGSDLFEQHPDLFRRLDERALSLIDEKVVPSTVAFSLVREGLRTGRKVIACCRLGAGLLHHGWRILPRGRMRAYAEVVSELVELAKAELGTKSVDQRCSAESPQ